MILKIGPHVPQIHPTAFIHPTAEISGQVIIGPGASIWGQCVLRGDVDTITIGKNSNVQDGTVIHTSHGFPTVLEEGVTIGHKAVVHGATVKAYSLVGMGAILMDGSLVEEHCLIGAGALMKEKGVIPKGHLAFGSPAKVIRPLLPEEIDVIIDRAHDYVKYAEQYKRALGLIP